MIEKRKEMIMRLKDLNQWQRKKADSIPAQTVEASPEVQAALEDLRLAEEALPEPQREHAANVAMKEQLEDDRKRTLGRLTDLHREREILAWRALVEKTVTESGVAEYFDAVLMLERRLFLLDALLGGDRLRFALERTGDDSRCASGNLAAARRHLTESREQARARMAVAD